MFKYHGYIIIESINGASVYDPDREWGERLIHHAESIHEAMVWIDLQSLAKQKEAAR